MTLVFVLLCLCLWGRVGVKTTEMTSIEVMEGDSVTLHSNVSEIQDDDLILWTFGPKDSYMAKISKAQTEVFQESVDGRFRGRLELDLQTGSLTLTNSSTIHSGSYNMEIVNGNKASFRTFSVTVYASLSVPVISRYSETNPSPSQRSPRSSCELLCSVTNVTRVTLSWYRGTALLSSISISELNTTLSLHLELDELDHGDHQDHQDHQNHQDLQDHQDNHTYSCMVHNPMSTRSKHLNPWDFCQPEKSSCVDYDYVIAEAVIRLVFSVLVGVATVAIMIYDICSRRE